MGILDQMMSDAGTSQPSSSIMNTMQSDAASPIAMPPVSASWIVANQAKHDVSIPQSAVQSQQKIDVSQPPNWFEQQLAKLPDIPFASKGGPISGFVQGMADPSVEIAQAAANVLPNSTGIPQAVSQWIQNQNQGYETARQDQGRSGFDAMRFAGNIASPINILGTKGIPSMAGASIPSLIGSGAAIGAAGGASQLVLNGDNYWAQKAGQTALGAAGGAVLAPVAGAISKVLSPDATARIQALRANGVNPTIGQTLGGVANTLEEKAQSIPLMGDMITNARANSRNQFNLATINKALDPIGEQVSEIGQEGVKQAGDKLSAAYDTVLTKLGAVKLDPQFQSDLGQLQGMASGLTPNMAGRFNSILKDNVMSRVSPNGSFLADTLKEVQSELAAKARSFSSAGGEQGELGDALSQLNNLLKQQVARASPEAASQLSNIDTGWANLVRIEGAAKGAMKSDGIFTPGQLLTAVRQADTSVRDRASARGTALLQDWANTGQSVLGNQYPDSGTAGRAMLGMGAVASGALSPAVPIGLGIGAAAYTSPIQRALVSAAADRPDLALKLAQQLRSGVPMLAPTTGNILAQFLRSSSVAGQQQ